MNYNDKTAAAAAGWTCSNCGEFVFMDRSHTCPTVFSTPETGVIPSDGWTATVFTNKEHREFALRDALSVFEQRLADHQITMPPEFIDLVSKHFWDLV